MSTLEVLRTASMGLILGDSESEVLLPNRYVPEGTSAGDHIEVFLYTDSEDRPIATTETPLAQADEFALLRVVSVGQAGAFLDWGLPKDLLLPIGSQLSPVAPDQQVVVWVYCDHASARPVATAKVDRYLDPGPVDLRDGQAVDLLFYEETDLGTKTIVDGRYSGLLYHELGKIGPEIGSQGRGYVQHIREDGKIDLTLVPTGKAGIDIARDTVLRALEVAGGRLEIGDRSEPAAIRVALGLSKKAFKRAIGVLYRERRIRIGEAFIETTDRDEIAEHD